jgi:hypothetical protein
MNVVEKVYSGPCQTFRMGLAFTGVILSTLDSDPAQLLPSTGN